MQLPKFDDCRLCRNYSSSECEMCDSGENFEPRGVRPLFFDEQHNAQALIKDDDYLSASFGNDLGEFDDD